MALKKALVDFNHQAVASSEQQKEVSVSLADEIAHIRRVQSDPQAVVRLVKERPDAMGSFMDALAESPSTMDKFIDVFSENEKVVDHVQKIIQAFVGENKRSSNGAGLNGSGSEPKKTEKDRVPQVEILVHYTFHKMVDKRFPGLEDEKFYMKVREHSLCAQ